MGKDVKLPYFFESAFDARANEIFDKNRPKYLKKINKIKQYSPYKDRKTVWTEDKIEQLTKLWEADLSTREIAEKLNLTKNAVIDKVKRLNLAMRGNNRNPVVKSQYIFR